MVEVATKYYGATDWAKKAVKDDFTDKDNKCNKFVCDVLQEALGKCPFIAGYTLRSPATAAQWADKDLWIPGFIVVDNPLPGDIVASKLGDSSTPGATGHVGIVVYGNQSISASYDKIVTGQFGFSRGEEYTYRRYVGSQPSDGLRLLQPEVN